ncbi:MAG: DUF3341 domain-containing protein [Gemmatimonadota bacterium]|nr:DUF3341 domain-containing protein [Gemmatimonadota bacterium]
MKRPRTGVLGVFAHLDTTEAAITRLRAEGFRELTVYSPTPRHEIEEALGPTESAVRIFTLTGAFTGTAAGTALAVWTSLDWPLIVGGKEIIALPAFSVIMFELTVLIGALSTVAGLFLLAKLPRIGRGPGLYHPSFSVDRFGIYAHVPRSRYEVVQALLTESGSEEVILDR